MTPLSFFNSKPYAKRLLDIESDILEIKRILKENKISGESTHPFCTEKGSLIGPKVNALLSHLDLELKKGGDYVLTKVNKLK
jgi:hypothetical protein